jgi:hypothetical protein
MYGSVGPCPLCQFLDLYTDGRTPWTGDQPVARPLRAHSSAQTQNKRTWTSIFQVGFQPSILVYERAKIDNDLDRAATVITIIAFYIKQMRYDISNIQIHFIIRLLQVSVYP